MADLIKVADAWERSRRSNNPGTYIVAIAGGLKFLLLRRPRRAVGVFAIVVHHRAHAAPAGRA